MPPCRDVQLPRFDAMCRKEAPAAEQRRLAAVALRNHSSKPLLQATEWPPHSCLDNESYGRPWHALALQVSQDRHTTQPLVLTPLGRRTARPALQTSGAAQDQPSSTTFAAQSSHPITTIAADADAQQVFGKYLAVSAGV
jgi:hypothetical protein